MTEPTPAATTPATPCCRTHRSTSRRTALAGLGVVGVGVPFLAACGGGDESATDAGSSPSADAGSTSPSASASESTGGDTGAAAGLTSTADIEVGGGTIFADEEVVVVQPTEGDFKGFSAVCTHQGCLVGSVTSEGIVCPCHNSVFSLEDGEPLSGPASAPLEEVGLTVSGDQISLA